MAVSVNTNTQSSVLPSSAGVAYSGTSSTTNNLGTTEPAPNVFGPAVIISLSPQATNPEPVYGGTVVVQGYVDPMGEKGEPGKAEETAEPEPTFTEPSGEQTENLGDDAEGATVVVSAPTPAPKPAPAPLPTTPKAPIPPLQRLDRFGEPIEIDLVNQPPSASGTVEVVGLRSSRHIQPNITNPGPISSFIGNMAVQMFATPMDQHFDVHARRINTYSRNEALRAVYKAQDLMNFLGGATGLVAGVSAFAYKPTDNEKLASAKEFVRSFLESSTGRQVVLYSSTTGAIIAGVKVALTDYERFVALQPDEWELELQASSTFDVVEYDDGMGLENWNA